MSVIQINEIGIFKCKFLGIQQCRNTEYAMLKVAFEVNLAGEIKDWNTIPNQKSLLMEATKLPKFSGLIPNKIYHFKMACKLQPARQKDGRNYPASINYEPIEVMGEAKPD